MNHTITQKEPKTSHLPCHGLDQHGTTPSLSQKTAFLFLQQLPSLISCPPSKFLSKRGENHIANSFLLCTALIYTLSTICPTERAPSTRHSPMEKANDPIIKNNHHLQVQGNALKVAQETVNL